jgi:hypothetical protein
MILTLQEENSLQRRVRSELIPHLDEVRRGWEETSTDDPEQQMGGYFELLDILEKEFKEDNDVHRLIEGERQRAGEWISERLDEIAENTPDYGDLDDRMEYSHSAVANRSVFDDVDL